MMKEVKMDTLKVFDVGDGFRVLVYDSTDERINEDLWNAFLVKNGYGMADYMFGVFKKDTTYDDFLEMIEATIDDEIRIYREMMLDDFGDEV